MKEYASTMSPVGERLELPPGEGWVLEHAWPTFIDEAPFVVALWSRTL